ncbi:hypothetical protein DYBT9275_03964 [Dyadobacter sp. CECT 9275]|uniref:Uncharacterized protein n=1 Tax=Dyadobacter helix TaxID=2822344 RepID=A0A916JH71_9BACT|nr:hypothetical protein DYBT9275_03964 [Dyadobacter sp. CECT 9275]
MRIVFNMVLSQLSWYESYEITIKSNSTKGGPVGRLPIKSITGDSPRALLYFNQVV